MLKRIVPICVGIVTILVLDAQLGNMSKEQFVAIFQSKLLRAATLFGAAYAANGNNAVNAVIAALIYFYIATLMESKGSDAASSASSFGRLGAQMEPTDSEDTLIDEPGT